MKIVWDEPKRLANLDKHGLDFADLNETFLIALWFCALATSAGLALAKTSVA
jgi:uncharacterized DUF497 family protein